MVLSRRTCVITDGRALFSLWPLYVCHISFIGLYAEGHLGECEYCCNNQCFEEFSSTHKFVCWRFRWFTGHVQKHYYGTSTFNISRKSHTFYGSYPNLHPQQKCSVCFLLIFSAAHHVAFLVIITILADVRWDLYSVSFAFVWSLVLLNILNIFCRFHVFFWKYCSFAHSQTGLLGLFSSWVF